MEMTKQARGVSRPVLYIITAYMVFLTIYTLGVRIDIFTTAFDMIREKLGFIYWYGIQVAGCGLIGLILIFVSRKTLKRADIGLLAGLMIWLAASAVMNRDLGGLKENLSGVVTIAVTVVAFYLVGRFFSGEDLHFCLTRVLLWGSVIWNYGCIVSLGMYFSNHRGYYHFGGFIRRSRQGLMDGRLFGCFSDPNYAALITLLLTGGLVFLLRYHRKSLGEDAEKKPLWFQAERIYIVISLIAYVLYFVLSGSRSGDTALVATVIILIVFVTWRDEKRSVRTFAVRLFGALAIMAVVYFGTLFAVQGIGQMTAPERDVETELERNDVSTENITNSRLDIWLDYLTLVKDRPAFGLSTRGALVYARQLDPESYLSVKGYNPHSMFVQMIVQGGVIGFLLMAVFLFRALIRIWKRGRNKLPLPTLFLLALFWVLIHGVFCVFNVGIFITPCFEAMLAWIGLGYLEQSCEEEA